KNVEPKPKRPVPEGDTIIRVFDSRRGTPQKTFSFPSESIGAAAFSHDDSTIVFRTYEGLMALDVITGDVKAKLPRLIDDGNARSNPPPPLAPPPPEPRIATPLAT